MKIEALETLLVDRYLYVKIYTDTGLIGIGESGAWGFLESSEAAIHTFGEYLIGEDPLLIEHHWQYMYRAFHFRGSAIMGAISAIDIALWDIAGQFHQVPIYALLGGKVRDKIRAYFHVLGDTKEKLVEGVKNAKKEGFTAVGHLTPFLDEDRSVPYFKTHVDKMTDAINTVAMYREVAGKDVDLCIEIHRRLTPAEAVVLGKGIEVFYPYFIEDPILPENYDSMAYVASKIDVPIATGERFLSIHEFEMLLTRDAVQYVRPDVCMAGGISHTKKIASLAESRYVNVVPHNPLSPVSTAACVQLAACIPNFGLQELPHDENHSPKKDIVDSPLKVENGFILLPDSPGLGIKLKDGIEDMYPPNPRKIETRLGTDGSIVDQ